MEDYKKYEADCERIRQENGVLLDKFAKYLKTKKLSEITIKTHVSNVDFYINSCCMKKPMRLKMVLQQFIR